MPSASRRLLVVIESLGRGGAERLLVTTLSHLDRARFDVSVATLWGPDALGPQVRDLGIEVVDLGLRGPRDVARAIRPLRRLIRRSGVDLVHTHLFAANVAGRVAARGLAPVVTTLHNPDYGREGPEGGPGGRRLLDGATAHLWPPTYLAVSDDVRRDYRTHLCLDRIRVLPNYLDVAGFRAAVAAADPMAVRRGLGLLPETFVFLHVGRFHHQKGHDVLIRAFGELARRCSDVALVLAGGGPAREEMEALARQVAPTAAIVFAGEVPEPASLYAAADAFVFPSRYEAFGMALLEAMASGLPTVVSAVGGILEVTTPETSLRVRPGDGHELAVAMEDLVAGPDLRSRLGRAGAARSEWFDVARLLPRLERVYAES